MANINDILSKYTFLPWMRQGLGAKIKETENFNNYNGGALGRPKVVVKARIKPKNGSTSSSNDDILSPVIREVELIGPGDITGIDRTAIVKTEPVANLPNFEPNYFPYIEFYEEDFPWRYTPAKADNNKLRPWLTLIVLKQEEFERTRGIVGFLPSIKLLPTQGAASGAESPAFPPPADTWAWAHVHFNGDFISNQDVTTPTASQLNSGLNRFTEILAAEPDRAVARLICPRKLEPTTAYTAFLIPTYETGRLAALGAASELIASIPAQKAAYGEAHPTNAYQDLFPVYYEWDFRTSTEGDFEYLVRQLTPQVADDEVGRRPMDIQAPGDGVGYGVTADPTDTHSVLALEGALLAPGTNREPFPWPNSTEYTNRLADYLNLSEDLLEATLPAAAYYHTDNLLQDDGGDIADDPIVTADVYGRWHALVRRVSKTSDNWIEELNLDPRNRAVAGLGVDYIKQNQDALMDKAWGQLGAVVEANRRIRWGQLAKEASHKGFEKNISSQSSEQLTAITSRVSAKLHLDGTPALATIKAAALPNAVLQSSFRKMERPNGPIMKRIAPGVNNFVTSTLRGDLANKTKVVTIEKTFSPLQSNISNASLNQNITQVNALNVNLNADTAGLFFLVADDSFLGQTALTERLGLIQAVGRYDSYFAADNIVQIDTGDALSLDDVAQSFKTELNPLTTIPKVVLGGIKLWTKDGVLAPKERIVPVMAYPKFAQPVYEYVVNLGEEFFIPNLDKLPNNSISLLETNPRFIESFMVGLNHEMGKELLWRQFPTDQRGSYFRQFWDTADSILDQGEDPMEKVQDIQRIHEWPKASELGTHAARPELSEEGNLVLAIRGDLLKKYPDLVVYAQKSKWQASDTERKKMRELDEEIRRPIFGARVKPDVFFLGFQLEEEEAKGNRAVANDPGWFFVLRERPGAIRFGYDEESSSPPAFTTWLDLNETTIKAQGLNGEHLNPQDDLINTAGNSSDDMPASDNVPWGHNAANMAQILYQNPFVICIHADEMLPK